MSEKEAWAYQLDWLNIIHLMGLDTIHQIPEYKREKVVKKLTKLYDTELLLSFSPSELDELVANELNILMKKELMSHEKQKKKIEKQLRSNMGPLKQRIIPIDMNDLKDLNPADIEDIKKFFTKMIMGKEDEDDNDDDNDTNLDDKTGYYI
jgi:Ni,Fe-hydrogenase I large subunit